MKRMRRDFIPVSNLWGGFLWSVEPKSLQAEEVGAIEWTGMG
jgi:hypothetical protein